MAEIVLYAVGSRPGEPDTEVQHFALAPIRHSSGYPAYDMQIAQNWWAFLDYLDQKLQAVEQTPPRVSNNDVLRIRNAIEAITEEVVGRAVRAYQDQPEALEGLRVEASQKFGFHPALVPRFRDDFEREIKQLIRFGVFVAAQKLVLYRVLQESGPRRPTPFALDPVSIASGATDPTTVQNALDQAWGHAIARSGDFESAFLPQPLGPLVFVAPAGADEVAACRVGTVWSRLQEAVGHASWIAISRNLVGFLYEMIVDPLYRHELGQFYTREDVVDLLVAFGVRNAGDLVLDPASGGGSFLWSAYRRKRDLGDTHEQALAEIWGCEITVFAAELSTITLATADTNAPAAYPRIVLSDFFMTLPGMEVVGLEIPDVVGPPRLPEAFDAVIGNPPYISYRRITNQAAILDALATMPAEIHLPKFSGKSDAYVWFIVHATRFLRQGGRLSFVVSSAMMFSDYGIPLIRFIGRHFKVVAVVDSLVERWFPEADTNTVLLMLERSHDETVRSEHSIRFVRLRRPLHRLLAGPDDDDRRQSLEDLVEAITVAPPDVEDPRVVVRVVNQGLNAGLEFVLDNDGDIFDDETEDEE